MRRYSEAVRADVRRRMSPPQRQSVARISEELGIHVMTLYKWRKSWRLQGEVVPASEKQPEVWSAADKFTLVLETAGLNATELSAYCREYGLFPEQIRRSEPRISARSKISRRSCSVRKRPCGDGGLAGAATKVGGLLLGGCQEVTSLLRDTVAERSGPSLLCWMGAAK